MSADLLREAAADIRAKAEAATPGPWTACPADQPYDDGEPGMFPHGWVGHTDDGRLYSFVAEPVQTEDGPATAEHIASWHPAVALAVADWLQRVAEQHRPEVATDVAQEDCERCGPDDDCEGHDEECCWICVGQWEEYAARVLYPCAATKDALSVARTYLGRADA